MFVYSIGNNPGLHMDSWVTLDSWVKPYLIIVLAIQNMMKESSFNITVGSSESFITLCMLRMQAICQRTWQSDGFVGNTQIYAILWLVWLK